MTLTAESMKELESMTAASTDLSLQLKYEAQEVELELYKKWLREAEDRAADLQDEIYRVCAENAVLLNDNDSLRAELRKRSWEKENELRTACY